MKIGNQLSRDGIHGWRVMIEKIRRLEIEAIRVATRVQKIEELLP
jgi:hypothetical protein